MISIINKLVQKALVDGSAIHKIYGQEVYRVEMSYLYSEVRLYHHGELILQVQKFDNTIVHIGGDSVSDTNAINTVLDLLNIPRYISRRGHAGTRLITA